MRMMGVTEKLRDQTDRRVTERWGGGRLKGIKV
jgi:hypothetical protein